MKMDICYSMYMEAFRNLTETIFCDKFGNVAYRIFVLFYHVRKQSIRSFSAEYTISSVTGDFANDLTLLSPGSLKSVKPEGAESTHTL